MLRKILPFILFAALAGGSVCRAMPSSGGQSGTRVVTDMAGRKVEVPAKIHKVLAMSPVGTILIYTLDPTLVAGWNYQPDSGEQALLLEPTRKLPVLGGWFGKNNTGNLEKIMQAHPDVLLSMGDPFATAQAERIQEQTHIPVLVLDGRLESLPDTYLKAGVLFGSAPRAAQLAAECRKTLKEIKQKIDAIPHERRRRYYYAEGLKGLETEPAGSMHSEAMNFAGGVNVAAEVQVQQGYGNTPVSMEQVLLWNPEIIIGGYDHVTYPGEFYRTVWSDPVWSRITAARNREVYETPQYPFCWIDRPPSVNRIIGLKWLANLFYPEIFHYDMRAETRRFYSEFYHWQLTDSELDRILATATRKTK